MQSYPYNVVVLYYTYHAIAQATMMAEHGAFKISIQELFIDLLSYYNVVWEYLFLMGSDIEHSVTIMMKHYN